ncbi:MAG: hypothetical protein HW420_702 [Candidatus Nitrosotenuis sp.]|nr:hypothetical protein [Candidatus Nitrosotenuis sp.]
MKTKLVLIILTAMVASMIFSAIPTVLADSQLDSLVNIATQARTQVKLQLDRADHVPGDIRALYEQGNSETELLIYSVKQQDITQSKQHFLLAMKIFKQISMTLSTQTAAPKAAIVPQTSSQTPTAGDIDYKILIDRTEKYTNTLKAIATKNNISVDFTKLDELVQSAKAGITSNDMASVEKIFREIKTTIIDIQNQLKEKTSQKSADRAKSFANEYINKIDALLSQAKELGLSDDDVTKLKRVREELSTTNDPSQIIVKVKRVITINIELKDTKSQKAISDTNKQADSAKTENIPEKTTTGDQNIKQEQKQKEIKAQRVSSIAKLEARLAKLEPSIDDNTQPKFDSAKSLLAELKSNTNDMDQRTFKSLDSLIREIESYVDSLQGTKDDSHDNTDQNTPTDSGKADTPNSSDSVKPNLKQKRPSDQKVQ